jgi:hypothetical protein
LLEPAECLCVGAAARRREVGLGEERVDRVGQLAGLERAPAAGVEPVVEGSSQEMRRLDRLLW